MQQTTPTNPTGGILLLTAIALTIVAAMRSPAGKGLHTVFFVVFWTLAFAAGSGLLGYAITHSPAAAGSVSGLTLPIGALAASLNRIWHYKQPTARGFGSGKM